MCHTASMQINVSAYIPGSTPIHACDARVKIALLLAYAVTLFLIETWAGLALCAIAFAGAVAASGVPVARYFGPIKPVYVIVAFTVAFNAFAFDAGAAQHAAPALAPGVAGLADGAAPLALVGSFGLVPAGLARGVFFAMRIVLLVAASLVVTYTTTSSEMTDALASFLSPLRRLRVPVDDIATTVSIALRFIPITAEELMRVRAAQWARGAAFEEGKLAALLRAWTTVLVPLFVGLFRRASRLACAMEARCYGAGPARTSLDARRFSGTQAAVLLVGLLVCIATCVVL